MTGLLRHSSTYYWRECTEMK